MKCCVGVTTHNPVSGLRLDLLEQTIESIERAFPTALLCLLDNGSTDGTGDVIDKMRLGVRWHPGSAEQTSYPLGNLTPGMGRNRLMALMDDWCAGLWGVNYYSEVPSFFVWSDDDMLWKHGAEDKLRAFWSAPDEDRGGVVLVSGLLEPVWHWNTPRRTVEAGGVRVLVRDSAPGAAWSFKNPRVVWPLAAEHATFGYDYKLSRVIAGLGLAVGQLDLADHLGWEASTHGNRAIEEAKPLDRDKWGI